jgi:hypothetical protein
VLDDAAFGAATEVAEVHRTRRPGRAMDRGAPRTGFLCLLDQLSARY